jgi:hypothetical protein
LIAVDVKLFLLIFSSGSSVDEETPTLEENGAENRNLRQPEKAEVSSARNQGNTGICQKVSSNAESHLAESSNLHGDPGGIVETNLCEKIIQVKGTNSSVWSFSFRRNECSAWIRQLN